jgi:hypothetical protein
VIGAMLVGDDEKKIRFVAHLLPSRNPYLGGAFCFLS